jgi:hypothetical protein
VHPSLFEFVSELCSSWNFKEVKIKAINSNTMTETCIRVAEDLPDTSTISISMPDTFFTEMGNIEKFNRLAELQELVPSLALWRIQTSQIGKLGQVQIDNNTRKITKLIDKDLSCSFERSWGMISLPLSLLRTFALSDSHPGISLSKLITGGLDINYLEISGKYFDCGTITEYREALELSLL